MAHSRRTPILRGLAAGISLLMLTLSVVVPVLDEGALFSGPVAESEHAPGDCPSGHDHTVCTQVGSNLAIDGENADGPVAAGALLARPIGGAAVPWTRASDRSNPSRAPPLA